MTEKERGFWNKELDGIEAALFSGQVDVTASAHQAKSSLSENLTVCAVAMGAVIVFIVTAAMIFKTWYAPIVGCAIGLIISYLIGDRWLKFSTRKGE